MSDLLLERSAELAAIDRALRVALAGHARQLLICGPPGSGRTALLEYARARDAHGLTVLAAAGEHGEREFPFALARRLLEPDEVAPLIATGSSWSSTACSLATAPALIVIDDLQWCDADSLDWLAFAARRLRRTGLALVAALGQRRRPDSSTARRCCDCDRSRARAVETLLHVELGHAVDARFAAACHRETGGRPLLVHEVAVAARRSRVHETGGAEHGSLRWSRPASGASSSAAWPRCRRRPGRSQARSRCSTPRPPRTRRPRSPDWDADAAAAAADALAARRAPARRLDDHAAAARAGARTTRSRRRDAHGCTRTRRRFGRAERHLLYSEPSADPWVVRHAAPRSGAGARARAARPGGRALAPRGPARACGTRGRR